MAELELLGGDADETRLLRDRTTGYSVAIPGHPTITSPPATGPRYDVVVALRDLPAQLGFRIDDLPTSLDPRELARALATSYATTRAAKPPSLKPISEHMRPPTSTAGAQSVYPLADVTDPAMEQLWVVLHPSPTGVWALYHTTWFRTADVNTFQWGHLRAAMIYQHAWDREHPRDVAPSIWPPSTITKPTANLDLTDEAWRVAESKAHDVGPIGAAEVVEIGDILRTEVQSDQSPRAEVVEMRADTIRGKIRRSAPPRVADVLLADLDQCHTMHDLRGWAWQGAWAVGNRTEVRKT